MKNGDLKVSTLNFLCVYSTKLSKWISIFKIKDSFQEFFPVENEKLKISALNYLCVFAAKSNKWVPVVKLDDEAIKDYFEIKNK